MSIISQAKHTGENTGTETGKVGIGLKVFSRDRIVYKVHTTGVRTQTLVQYVSQ